MLIILKEVTNNCNVSRLLFENPDTYIIHEFIIGSGGPGVMKDIGGTIIGDGTAHWWQEYCNNIERKEMEK